MIINEVTVNKLDPTGKQPYHLVKNYLERANATAQQDMKEITEAQMTNYLMKAHSLGLLNTIDPDCLIKVGKEANDIRMVSSPDKKYSWDLEVFADPILKRFSLVDNDPDKIYCDIEKNYYRALKVYNEIDPLEYQMAYNIFPLYADIRTINGIRVNPPRIYNETELYHEVERLAKKRIDIANKIKHPDRYYKAPNQYEKKIFYKGPKDSFMKATYDKYYQNCYVICLANHGYRGVRSRIEQWVWEQHVMRYYRDHRTRTLLNNLILDDDGIYCKILVPFTYDEFGLLQFIYEIKEMQVYDGVINDLGYDNFNISDYYKNFPELVDKDYLIGRLLFKKGTE